MTTRTDEWQFNHAVNWVKNQLQEGENLNGTYIAYSEKEQYVMPLRYKDEREKEKLFEAITAFNVFNDIQHYVIISEAWIVVADPNDPDAGKVPPSQHPRRQDGVIILSVNRNRTRSAQYLKVDARRHPNSRKRFRLEPFSDKAGDVRGPFTELLSPEVFVEKFKRLSVEDQEKAKALIYKTIGMQMTMELIKEDDNEETETTD